MLRGGGGDGGDGINGSAVLCLAKNATNSSEASKQRRLGRRGVRWDDRKRHRKRVLRISVIQLLLVIVKCKLTMIFVAAYMSLRERRCALEGRRRTAALQCAE